jgi:hypothetical protein
MKYFVLPSLRHSIALSAAALFIYYFLLHHNALHASISSIVAYADTLSLGKHLLMLGVLPVYISFIVFGAMTLGVYISLRVEQLISEYLSKK